MSEALSPPARKDPLSVTRSPKLPPGARSRLAHGLTAAAACGEFRLQSCRDCGCVQYPAREACRRCLSTKLDWRAQDPAATLIATTVLHHSNDLFFRERLPWRLGLIKLDCGPSVLAHLHRDCVGAGARVRAALLLDKAGQAVIFALPLAPTEHMSDDPQLRQMTCDPKHRKILITDGKSALGEQLARALLQAGAQQIWFGYSEPWKRSAGFERLAQLSGATPIPLDLTDSRSVEQVAAEIGGKVDIVVNNAEYHRPFGIAARTGIDAARAEMDINYFGLLRLSQQLAPALRARAADGPVGAVAWVNLLSIYALANFPPHGTFSASKAAAHSLAQCLRAELQASSIRVVNVYPGPIDDEWNQNLPPPKLSAQALAGAIVAALQSGVEDVYPGDVAQEWFERWRDNPKALERELAAGQ